MYKLIIMKKLITLLLFLCPLLSLSQNNVIDSYFYEIAYRSEFNDKIYTKKWNEDIKIFISDYKSDLNYNDSLIDVIDSLKIELIRIVDDLNNYIDPINLTIVNDSTESNFFIYLGSSEWFNINVPQTKPYTKSNFGLAWVTVSNNIISKSEVYVDLHRISTTKEKRHLLREEITQSLGLLNDSYKYPSSIFYQGWTDVTEYSDIDIALIKKLYNE